MAITELYNVADVKTGYDFWKRQLLRKTMSLFYIKNLPVNLSKEMLLTYLFKYGFVGVFNHPDYGIVCCNGSLSGTGLYNKALKYTYSHVALGSKTLTIDKDCVVGYCSSQDFMVRKGLYDIIKRYARILADIDSSLDIAIINTRDTEKNVAKNKAVARSLEEYYKNIEQGKRYIVVDENILESLERDTNAYKKDVSDIKTLLDCRQDMIKSFYQELGINFLADSKRERMIEDEVNHNDDILTLNIEDVYKQIVIMINKINAMFNTEIEISMKGVVE